MSTCASFSHKLSSCKLWTDYLKSRVKTQSYFKDQPVFRCEVQEMGRLDYFFWNRPQSFFVRTKALVLVKN